MIYNIASRRAWREALQRGEYRAENLEADGFIHCSTNTQVLPVAEQYYPGQRGLLVLMIDPARLASELKWEPPSGGAPPPGVSAGEMFPHIYGPINLDAVVKIFDLETDRDGKHTVPALE